MPEALNDEERSRLASRFKMQFLPRLDASFIRAHEEGAAANARQSRFALEVVDWFEKHMRTQDDGKDA